MIEYIFKFICIVYTFILLLKCFSEVNPVQRFLFKCNIKSLIVGDLQYFVLFHVYLFLLPNNAYEAILFYVYKNFTEYTKWSFYRTVLHNTGKRFS